MKRVFRMKCLTTLFILGFGILSAAPQPSSKSDFLLPIAWMAGGVWRGEVQGPSGTAHIEQRITKTLEGHAMSFTTTFNGKLTYEGHFAYDASQKAIAFFYASSDGSITRGTVSKTPDFLLWDFRQSEADGSTPHYQVHVHPDGPDDYTWSLFAPKDVGWAQLFSVKYHRVSA